MLSIRQRHVSVAKYMRHIANEEERRKGELYGAREH